MNEHVCYSRKKKQKQCTGFLGDSRKDVGKESGSDQCTISRQIDLSESIESEMVGDLAVERPSKTCGKIRARAATAIDKVRSHS
jgi:hypothetical protein